MSGNKSRVTKMKPACLLRPRDIAYLIATVDSSGNKYPRKKLVADALQDTWKAVNAEKQHQVVTIEVLTMQVEFERQAVEDAERRKGAEDQRPEPFEGSD